MSDDNIVYFLYFDDAYKNGIIHKFNKNIRILKPNEKQDCNATFRLENMPHNIVCSFAEFQEQYGKIICIIDKSIESKLTEKHKKYLHRLEKVSNNNYYLVTGYGITLKNTNLKLPRYKINSIESNLTCDVCMKFVRVNNLGKNGETNNYRVLKFKKDDTVTISNAPNVIKTTLHQYERKYKCILVKPIDDSYSGNSDIIELRNSMFPGRYIYTRVCKKSENPQKKKVRQ